MAPLGRINKLTSTGWEDAEFDEDCICDYPVPGFDALTAPSFGPLAPLPDFQAILDALPDPPFDIDAAIANLTPGDSIQGHRNGPAPS